MEKRIAEELIIKYVNGECTPEEKVLVESGFLHDLKNNEDIISPEEVERAGLRMRSAITERISANQRKTRLFSYAQISVAASVLLIIGVGLYFYQSSRPHKAIKQSQYTYVVKPGSNKAYLTLGNGKRIALDNSVNHKLAKEPGTIISKSANGQLIYTVDNVTGQQQDLTYNTVETPRGGQFQVNLPDGSKVWLNAASSIRFPTVFNSNERKVELKGEAYFEVAKNKEKPFRVSTVNQVVEVLGTHFNVNAYRDESFEKTTLLEGSVRINKGTETVLLKPGQQSRLNKNTGIKVSEADSEEVIAWKNGMFQFNNADIKTIMRQIARWYDVDISYEANINTDVRFNGEIPRNAAIREILDMLDFAEIKFKIQGNKIIITP
jgi:transmembrane sensor